MGQRTAIILQHVNKYAAKFDRNKKVSTRVFYNSWGIGRVLPSQLLVILNGTLSAGSYCEGFAKTMKPCGCRDITEDYEKEDRLKMNGLDFSNPEGVGDIINKADNNNGGIFIRITTGETGDTESIEYAYMLGHENEGGKYKSFVTFEEWAKKNYGDEYIDEDFLNIYKSTIKYFGAVEKVSQTKQLELFEKEV